MITIPSECNENLTIQKINKLVYFALSVCHEWRWQCHIGSFLAQDGTPLRSLLGK